MKVKLTTYLIVLLFILSSCTSTETHINLPYRPNILFIMVDDLNHWVDFLNNYNHIKSPNLSKLAARSYNFTNAHSPSTQCNPARSAVLSGKLPNKTKIYNNKTIKELNEYFNNGSNLVRSFKDSGYITLGTGKIFHRASLSRKFFDEYFETSKHIDYEKYPKLAGVIDEPEMQFLSDVQASNWTAQKLQEQYGKPFLLMVGFNLPHEPWYFPERYFDLYENQKILAGPTQKDDLKDIPDFALKKFSRNHFYYQHMVQENSLVDFVRAYLAGISFMDERLGEILHALETSPHANNTVIVLISDHGDHFGEKEMIKKGTLWEVTTHVPCLIYIPGIKQGKKCTRVISTMDIYPTLIELCGLNPEEGLDGRSILPLIHNPKSKWDYPAISIHGEDNYSIRTEKWRYIRYRDGGEELYDHSKDPHEYKNLINKNNRHKYKKLIESFPKPTSS